MIDDTTDDIGCSNLAIDDYSAEEYFNKDFDPVVSKEVNEHGEVSYKHVSGDVTLPLDFEDKTFEDISLLILRTYEDSERLIRHFKRGMAEYKNPLTALGLCVHSNYINNLIREEIEKLEDAQDKSDQEQE